MYLLALTGTSCARLVDKSTPTQSRSLVSMFIYLRTHTHRPRPTKPAQKLPCPRCCTVHASPGSPGFHFGELLHRCVPLSIIFAPPTTAGTKATRSQSLSSPAGDSQIARATPQVWAISKDSLGLDFRRIYSLTLYKSRRFHCTLLVALSTLTPLPRRSMMLWQMLVGDFALPRLYHYFLLSETKELCFVPRPVEGHSYQLIKSRHSRRPFAR